MNTYLVHGFLRHSTYDDGDDGNEIYRTEETRLVKATSPEEAEQKFIKVFAKDDPYNTSVSVVAKAHETIE